MEFLDTYLLQYITPAIMLVACSVNVIVDLLKDAIKHIPIPNSAIFRIAAFLMALLLMWVLAGNIVLMNSVVVDGLIAGMIAVLFYDTRIYPYIKERFMKIVRQRTGDTDVQ